MMPGRTSVKSAPDVLIRTIRPLRLAPIALNAASQSIAREMGRQAHEPDSPFSYLLTEPEVPDQLPTGLEVMTRSRGWPTWQPRCGPWAPPTPLAVRGR